MLHPVSTAGFNYDGTLVKSVLNGVTTYYIGTHFEWTGDTISMIKYYYAGSQRVAMRQGSSTLYFLLGDHLGSTSITANSNGTLYTEQRYCPWGDTRYNSPTTTPTAYQYTGQRNDATGLYFYNARYYDPSLSRFISPDTIIPDPANPQSLNRFSYTLNNPLRYTDPTGHAHYNPGDGSYSTHPKVCYSYTYPKPSQPAQKATPTTTQILSAIDNLITTGDVALNAYRSAALSAGRFTVASGIGPTQLVSRGDGIVRIGTGVPWARVYGYQTARQIAKVDNLSIAVGEPALELAGQYASGSLARGLSSAEEAVMSLGTWGGVLMNWGIDYYDYTWGDHADASRIEFAAAMTVDTAALLSSTALGAGIGGAIGGPVGAPIGAVVGGGLYLYYSLGPRETAIHWTDTNIITPAYNAWLMAPNQSLSTGYYP